MNGAIASPHTLATRAGFEAFADGGNAIDAALAAAAMLAVVYPHQCSVGGDLFAVVAAGETTWSVNGSGAAPREIDVSGLRSEHREIPEEGPLSITVPGVVAAWERIAELGSRLGLGRCLARAITVARDGVQVSRSLADGIRFRQAILAKDPGMSTRFFSNGLPLAQGALLRQPELASTLESIAANGASCFYRGPVAEDLVSGLRSSGSPLTLGDLSSHVTEITAPLELHCAGFSLQTSPPNSQGFVLLETMAALEAVGA